MKKGQLLEELNHEEAKQYVGGIIFVTIIMIIGIIGNLHVLFVYTFRMKPSNHRIFILSLAVLDMITCTVGMPFIIVDLRNPLTFTMISACKVLRFVNYFICISSALILTIIAIDRYRKICVPLGKQISRRIAKILILVCLGISMVLSWPAPALYGHSSINTTNPNITGVRCFTEDKFKNTKFQAYFNAVLILVVFGVFGILLVMYSLIGRVISKHTTFKSSVPGGTSSDTSKSKITVSTDASSEDKPSGFKGENMLKNIKTVCSKEKVIIDIPMASTDSSSSAGTKHKLKAKKHEKSKFDRAKRTTFMFFLITAFFFISYFPHLTLKILAFVKTGFVSNMSFSGKILYNTFVWCFFINNMSNCFVYGFCDTRFRTEVKKIYNTLFCRKR
ncbi:growth hormone secretagogue receptor type 1-like [Mytilus californianus]|uniref:growth hormone secretagogue receptor type 1-like n=1 Tax=Mytilus californianus TaxID=6549 RepID=UPI0022465008|nr:growth hormone secretagogue receptor type 1-like [Mytilus californianus]